MGEGLLCFVTKASARRTSKSVQQLWYICETGAGAGGGPLEAGGCGEEGGCEADGSSDGGGRPGCGAKTIGIASHPTKQATGHPQSSRVACFRSKSAQCGGRPISKAGHRLGQAIPLTLTHVIFSGAKALFMVDLLGLHQLLAGAAAAGHALH